MTQVAKPTLAATHRTGWGSRLSALIGMLASMLLGSISNSCYAQDTQHTRLDFNRDIRPILSENCFYCHGQDGNKREADLRLDVRQAAEESGAIKPGDSENSGIISRIYAGDPEVVMPPPKSNRRLSDEQKELLKRWIAEGAEYSNHWAFDPIRDPVVPVAAGTA